MFRQLGRQFELFVQITKRVANDPSISRCEVCGAWISAGGESCLYCGHRPPHEVLDVAADAPEADIEAAARGRLKRAHPDQGGSKREFRRVLHAREELLDR
jgi:DnaJ-class molecular chaperone